MFERLTNPKHGNVRSTRFPQSENKALQWASRLAEYEDSGLSPEEITEKIVDLENKISDLKATLEIYRGFDGCRLNQLIDADMDGRLVVLPCKVGDELWVIRYGEIRRNYAYQWHLMNSPEQCFLSMYDDHCGLLDFGKTVFLTREAAEKALGGGEG